jgi:hypothetical protein
LILSDDERIQSKTPDPVLVEAIVWFLLSLFHRILLFYSFLDFQLMKVVSVWNILKTQNSDSEHGTKLHNPTHQKTIGTIWQPRFVRSYTSYTHTKITIKRTNLLTNGGFAQFFFFYSSTKMTARYCIPLINHFSITFSSFHPKFYLLHVVAMFVVSCGGDQTRGNSL